MQLLRLALDTCGFYLAAVACIQAAMFAAIRWTGSVSITFLHWTGIGAFAAFFGLIWLGSFLLAFRIVFADVWKFFA